MNILRSIFSVTLIPLLLLSTTGLRISQHWCGNALINATIWGDAEPCEHFKSEEKPACPFHAKMQAAKKCCSEREVYIDGSDDDFLAQLICSISYHPTGVVMIRMVDLFDHVGATIKEAKFHNHSPPLIKSSIFLLIACFRI
ncbi:MAG: hypothetical protein R2813_09960 [Flavobacteriales bacterium]